MLTVKIANPGNVAGDLWGGLAAMLVALPSAIAFGVTIFSPLGGTYAAQGAIAGILGVTAIGLVAGAFGGTNRLISAPCAPAAAVLSALAIQWTQNGITAESAAAAVRQNGNRCTKAVHDAIHLLYGFQECALNGIAGVLYRLHRLVHCAVNAGDLNARAVADLFHHIAQPVDLLAQRLH